MNKNLKKIIKESKEMLLEMAEESDLTNRDCLITAILGIEPKEAANISDDKMQQVLNEEGIYKLTDLLALTAKETWEEDKESAEKLEKIKKRIIEAAAEEKSF